MMLILSNEIGVLQDSIGVLPTIDRKIDALSSTVAAQSESMRNTSNALYHLDEDVSLALSLRQLRH